ncbi:hypothetical protein [Streptomyces sp. NPDC004270]
MIHQILADAEPSRLKRHRAVVVRPVALPPAKPRSTCLVGASERQQGYWMPVFMEMRGS